MLAVSQSPDFGFCPLRRFSSFFGGFGVKFARFGVVFGRFWAFWGQILPILGDFGAFWGQILPILVDAQPRVHQIFAILGRFGDWSDFGVPFRQFSQSGTNFGPKAEPGFFAQKIPIRSDIPQGRLLGPGFRPP